jgi:hypothetical protein
MARSGPILRNAERSQIGASGVSRDRVFSPWLRRPVLWFASVLLVVVAGITVFGIVRAGAAQGPVNQRHTQQESSRHLRSSTAETTPCHVPATRPSAPTGCFTVPNQGSTVVRVLPIETDQTGSLAFTIPPVSRHPAKMSP